MEPDDFSFLRGLAQPEKKKRKRGGLAGIWDRNKNIITPLATGIVGAVPGLGPMAAAGLGAAMRGLDRPGKRGIGFDVGQGLRGAAEGAIAGKAGSAIQKGLPNLLGTKASETARDTALEQAMGVGRPAASMVTSAPPATTAGQTFMGRLGDVAGNVGSATTRGLGKLLQSPEGLGMGLQALSGVMGAQSQRRLEEERLREERRRAENFARLAMPLYLESMQRRGGR